MLNLKKKKKVWSNFDSLWTLVKSKTKIEELGYVSVTEDATKTQAQKQNTSFATNFNSNNFN